MTQALIKDIINNGNICLKPMGCALGNTLFMSPCCQNVVVCLACQLTSRFGDSSVSGVKVVLPALLSNV